jgi:hypothetical protein
VGRKAEGSQLAWADTHLSVPRLLLRKRRAVLVTSSVRRHKVWSTSLLRGSQSQSCLDQAQTIPRVWTWPQDGVEESCPPHPSQVLTQPSAAPEASSLARPAGPVPVSGPGNQHPALPTTYRWAGSGPHHLLLCHSPLCHLGQPLTLAVL